MSTKRIPLTKEQFDQLELIPGWTLSDVPPEHWDKIPGLQRRDEIVAVFASGCCTESRILNGIDAVAGFDLLAHESRPQKNEPEGNAYHYVLQESQREDVPYILHGPFPCETRVTHWYEAGDLDIYWKGVG